LGTQRRLDVRIEKLRRPLSVSCVRDGGAYALPAGPLVRTNVYFKIGCVDDLFIKVPSKDGLDEYRQSVKLGQPTAADVRSLEEAERFDQLASATRQFTGFADLTTIEPELAHFLVVHKLQYERLRAGGAIAIPTARFGVLRSGRLFRRFEPALFQARVPGTTLWEMFDFEALQVLPAWRSFLPAISEQLTRLLDSSLLNHVDWNIQNFVFEQGGQRLFYVDMKPTTFVAKHSNDHNLKGIRQYYVA
jgi:hypothetical protein